MNLADYDPNQPKKPPLPGAPGGNIADAFGAQMPSSAPPPVLAPGGNKGTPHMSAPYGTPPPLDQGPQIPQTLPGSTAGDVKPGPTLTPPAAPDPSDPFASMGGGVKLPGGEWVPKDHPLAQQGAAGAPAAPGAPGAPAAPGAPGADPNAPPATVADAFKKTLMDKLNQGPVSLNDPALKAQSDAYAVGQTRGSEMQRAQAAERLASQGLGSSGAADGAYSGIAERAGENMAGFNAGLMGDAAKQQADEIRAYMTIAGNQLNADEARKLQDTLTRLDIDARKYGIDKQAALGQGDLDLRGQLGSGQLNLGLLQALMQNDQFGRGLNQQGSQFSAGLDQQGILGLLGLL